MAETGELHTFRIDGDGRVAGGGGEIFPWWSVTKTVIAICALSLVEEGRAELDAPLPGEGFTLRQLLGHTAGLPDYYALPEYRAAVARDEEPWPPGEMLKRARTAPLFAPGEGWAYSNIGSMLARQYIEEVAGAPLAEMVARRVAGPLGLGSVELATRREDFQRVHWPEARHYHPGWVYHGCLIGTAGDAARLLHGLFAGRLLGAEMLREMTRPHPLGGALPGRPWTSHGYALGLMSGEMGEAGRAIGHSGGGPFSVNAVYHFPDQPGALTVACFTDGTDEGFAERAAARAAMGKGWRGPGAPPEGQ
ncbi:serine hydrolase domain-containing protein [Pseudoroseicyclus tamaricis]|uniref:Beta-lactamase family protein n=1 Tax=Pseudoroseicyclus tamaricis TaxID=2705421 RepID=A0A6B2K7C6_9RHOB|nr:serine hydrolase domain-containing protein [Pseudoroseicyclus tamaricis]NDV02886.1 beta-lactamase family protein [Pseudoroseicyclus tamaricis]